jgi:MATE family multidrug resistance protein
MGLAILIEVTGFAFMAIFISRLGETPVAGHQIAANLVALLFMAPLGLSNATSTLVAQRIGADDLRDARRIGWHGVQLALLVALAMGGTVFVLRDSVLRLYTDNAAVVAAAAPAGGLGSGLSCRRCSADGGRLRAAGVAHRHPAAGDLHAVAVLASAWAVDLCWPSISWRVAPAPWQGARGFWIASTAGLVVAAVALTLLLVAVLRRQKADQATHSGTARPA